MCMMYDVCRLALSTFFKCVIIVMNGWICFCFFFFAVAGVCGQCVGSLGITCGAGRFDKLNVRGGRCTWSLSLSK
jgi:hypothetical protein